MKRLVIGTLEYIKFHKPLLRCVAKIDTGASHCVLHADKIERDGDILVLHFTSKYFFPDLKVKKKYKVKKFKMIRVRTSEGRSTERYAIYLRFSLGSNNQEYRHLFTITDRSSMEYPVLLGISFLRKHRFMVDTSASFLLGDEGSQGNL